MIVNKKLSRFFEKFTHSAGAKFKISEHTVLILVAFLVGTITGTVAVGFRWLVITAGEIFLKGGSSVLHGFWGDFSNIYSG